MSTLLLSILLAGPAQGRPAGAGLALADPLGASGRLWLGPSALVQASAGARLLCPETGCTFPGPLTALDAALAWPPRDRGPLHGHAGLGLAGGTMAAGCWYDAVEEVCLDATAAAAFLRAPLGLDLVLGRLELTAEAVPAVRAMPQLGPTFQGGLSVRWMTWE